MKLLLKLRSVSLLVCICVLPLILGLPGKTYAQADNKQVLDLPRIIPASPDAASLGRYGDIPVGKYTGTINIGIPLHTLTLGKFSLPVSLNYFSSGLKVEELSGWIGLGWSLNAGGVITRSVQGKPDEKTNGYWNYGLLSNDALLHLDNSPIKSLLWQGYYDLEPDMFYYNFAGRSGKFVIDATPAHNVHCIPYQNIKIQHDADLSGFTITDEAGNQYKFETLENTSAEPSTYTSAWFLSKIITTSGNIDFTYGSELEYTNRVQVSYADYTRLDLLVGEKDPDVSIQEISIVSKVLRKITTPAQTIDFYASRNRKDLSMCSILDSIVIRDYDGVRRKKFSLSHSYFGDYTNVIADKVRLKLDTLKEHSVTDNAVKFHTFEYYNPQSVPSIKSNAQDYWGYYNGKTNNSLLPKVTWSEYSFSTIELDGADRTPSADYAINGMLKNITYPTGGSSTFNYEGNDYGYTNTSPINDSVLVPAITEVGAQKSATITVWSTTKEFTITSSQRVGVFVSAKGPDQAPLENGPTVYLDRVNANGTLTNIFSWYAVFSNIDTYKDLAPGTYRAKAIVDGENQRISLALRYTTKGPPLKIKPIGGLRIREIVNSDMMGKYTRLFYTYRSTEDTARSSGSIMSDYRNVEIKYGYLIRSSYPVGHLGTTQGAYAGYQTVTEFTSTDARTNPLGKKEYYYNVYPADQYATFYQYITPFEYQGTTEGLTMGSFAPDGKSLKMASNLDMFRGLLMKEIVYNAADMVVKSSVYQYNLEDGLNQRGPNYLRLSARRPFGFTKCKPNCIPCYFGNPGAGCNGSWLFVTMVGADVISPWVYKKAESETIYDDSGNNPITTNISYYYENPSHAQVTKTETLNSTLDTIRVITKYPGDRSNISGLSSTASAALTELDANNNIAPAIEVSRYKNNTLLHLQRTDYRIWDAARDIVEPEHVLYQSGTNPLENRLDFFNYDTTANILEQAKANDVHTVFLWGYNNQYPVAKVTGSSYAAVLALVSNNNILKHPVSDQQLRDEINRIRTGLAGTKALVTTYTYLPLIGLSSETDPTGKTIYYEYNSFGQLRLIKDQQGKILKLFDYQYQTPVTL